MRSSLSRPAESAILLGVIGLRLALAAGLGPGRDELAYWYWSWHALDAGYSLVTVAAVRLSTAVLGDGALAMRVPTMVAAAAAVVAAGRLARRLGATERGVTWVRIAFAVTPWQTYAGTVVHPDAFFALFVLLLAERTAALAGGDARALPAAAALAGLAALTKLTGTVLLAVVAVLAWRHRRAAPGAAAGAAALLVAAGGVLLRARDPHLLTAMRELGRFAPEAGVLPRLVTLLGEVLVLAGPALLMAGAAGAIAAARAGRASRPVASGPVLAIAVVLLAVHVAFALAGQAKGNWFLPPLALLLPLGVATAGGPLRGWATAVAASAAISLGGGVTALSIASAPHVAGERDDDDAREDDLLARLNSTYRAHVGRREAEVSGTRTWTERFAEYRPATDLPPPSRGRRPAAPHPEPRLRAGVRGRPRVGARRRGAAPRGPGLPQHVRRTAAGGRAPRVRLPDPAGGAARNGAVATRDTDRSLERLRTRGVECSRGAACGGGMDGMIFGRTKTAALLAATVAIALSGSRIVRAGETAPPDHTTFDALLRRYVKADGVDYAAWSNDRKDRRRLRAYVTQLERATPSELEETPGGRDEALAYWINLYNAATLRFVLNEYPVDSIKDLGSLFSSPWDRKVVKVEGRSLTLNQIENDIIRSRFQEPRIHFALNCAARSCPPLRAGAYTGDRLDEQLEEQTRAFLGNPEYNRVEGGHYHLSRIFDWYRKDFERAAGSVQAYVRPYLVREGGADPGEKAKPKHLDYDWSLNDANALP